MQVVFSGDSLLKESFRELCDFINAPYHWSPATNDTTGHHSGGHCIQKEAKITVRFDWNAFGDYPPLRLTNAELGKCSGSAGNRSFYTDLDAPGCADTPEKCPVNRLVDLPADFDVVVVGTGLWHTAPSCGLNSSDPLKSIRAMVESLYSRDGGGGDDSLAGEKVTYNATGGTKIRRRPLMVLRSNPTVARHNRWPGWDTAQANQYLLRTRDGLAELARQYGAAQAQP